MKNILVKWAIVVVFFAATFIPPYGGLYLAWDHLFEAPLLVICLMLAWVMPAAFFFPLSINVFRVLTCISISGIYGILLWSAVDFFSDDPLGVITSMWVGPVVVLAGIIIGWLMISTRLYRQARGTYVVTGDVDVVGD